MLYAPTDVQSIFLPDGCGNPHLIDDADRLVLDCGQCETAMAAHKHLGWAAQPQDVAPTCDELLQAERDEKAAQKAGVAHLTSLKLGAGGSDPQMAALLAALTEQNTRLMEQIAAMTAAQAAKPEPLVPPATPEPVVPSDAAAPIETVAAPAKRAPGRPPKNAKAE